jgi:hypothetical protein
MKTPNMGQISNNSLILLNSIYCGCWICQKGESYIIYDGTGLGLYDGNFLEEQLFNILLRYKFITHDSGNWDFNETFYRFNPDFNVKDNFNLTAIYLDLQYIIKDKNYKEKYNLLIREEKLKRILK